MVKASSPYLTAKEVAEFLRVHLITVYRLTAAKALHPVKIGRMWRFERSEVETFAKSSRDVMESGDRLVAGSVYDNIVEVLSRACYQLAHITEMNAEGEKPPPRHIYDRLWDLLQQARAERKKHGD